MNSIKRYLRLESALWVDQWSIESELQQFQWKKKVLYLECRDLKLVSLQSVSSFIFAMYASLSFCSITVDGRCNWVYLDSLAILLLNHIICKCASQLASGWMMARKRKLSPTFKCNSPGIVAHESAQITINGGRSSALARYSLVDCKASMLLVASGD